MKKLTAKTTAYFLIDPVDQRVGIDRHRDKGELACVILCMRTMSPLFTFQTSVNIAIR